MQIKTKIVSCHTADSKPVKQEVKGTLILPPLIFPGRGHTKVEHILELNSWVGSLPAIIMLLRKGLAVTNTIAHNTAVLITTV